MSWPWPVAIRARLFAGVLIASAVIVAVLVTGFNIALRRTLSANATSLAEARAAAVLPTLEASGGRITIHEAPDDAAIDTQLWVFDRSRAVEAPQPSTPQRDAMAARVAARPPTIADAPGRIRLASVPISGADGVVGAVVAGVPLAPYDATARTALIASVVLGAGLLVAIALLTFWTLRRALRPVYEMTRLAQDWSEHALDQRFARGIPRDELTQLAATLDQLLDRLAASLRREQRFSTELAHELRTPLARIAAECELALRARRGRGGDAETFAAIARSADEMRRTIDALVTAARHGAGHGRGTADARQLLESLAHAASPAAAARTLEITADAPPQMRVAVDEDLAIRIVQPIVENAVRYAARCVALTAQPLEGQIAIIVADDGPGVAADERERIFEPGARGRDGRGDGAGLGLALSRRLAQDVAGSVSLESENGRGARFVVRLPRG
jgi:signal transduction histidine kinase